MSQRCHQWKLWRNYHFNQFQQFNSSLIVNHLIQWIMGVNGVDKIGSKSNQNKASVPNTFRYVSYIAV